MTTEEAIERIKSRYDKWVLDDKDLEAIQYIFPELSESEDERIRKNLIELLLDTPAQDIINHHLELSKVLAYLERRKEQKSAKWNDADDKIQRNLMSLLSCMRGDRIAEDTYKKYYPWLRDLPKRFNLYQSAEWSEDTIRKAVKEVGLTQHQIDWLKINVFSPKQEWSEEDVERLAKKRASKSGTLKSEMIFYRQGVRDAFNCKGLRLSWKPSREQMDTLKTVYEYFSTSTPTNVKMSDTLRRLYNDLKKL